MKTKKIKNFFFYLPLLIIMIISLFLMYHSKIISPLYKNNFLKQSIFFFIGITLLLLKDKIKIKWLFEYSHILYFLNIILLIAVLFLGSSTNGAKAWFNLGVFSFQPSELMKLILCLYLSKITQKQQFKTIKDQFIYLIKVFLIILIPSILVFLEPDTGAIIFYFLIAFSITFLSPISKKWFLLIIISLTSILSLFFYTYFYQQELLIKLIGTSFFYRVERIFNFQQGLQITNALTALGSAPLYTFNLKNIIIYIPEAPTDFAFALTSNVFGILGNIIVLICYLFIDIYLINLWTNKRKTKDQYFISGFLFMFLINQIQNILMNIGLIPIMGIPLPFLSYGGSTTIVYFLFLMIILKKQN